MPERTNLQKAAMLFGVVFLIVTIAGFIPGLTTDYDRVWEIGGEGGKLLGLFGVNWLENLAHLLFAVGGFAMASTHERARTYFLGGGAIYLLLWIYGLIIDEQSNANLIGVNDASNWLHFVLALAFFGVGILLSRDRDATGRRAVA